MENILVVWVFLAMTEYLDAPLIGIIFFIELFSSALQIFSKKVFKKKIFLSAPLHHHLEALGWPETKITMRFWVIGTVMAAIGLVIALLGRG